MSPGPIRFGHQATVSSADGPGSRLESIDRYRRRRLSTQSFMLGSPGFSFFAREFGRLDGKKTWLDCVQFRKKLCDSTDTFPFSEGSASGDDKRGTSSTRNSTSTLVSVRSLKVRPLSQDGCLLCKKGITDSAVLVLLCNAR